MGKTAKVELNNLQMQDERFKTLQAWLADHLETPMEAIVALAR